MSRRRLTATEIDLDVLRQRALLVGTGIGTHDAEAAQASLDELALLVDTAGADPVELVLQRRDTPDPATYIGSGKAKEMQELAETLDIDLVVFDDELTPAQQRNLEKLFAVDVVDRTALILDIFAQHAKSQEGMVQVELAQLRYRLPRLRGRGKQLSQQGAGGGARGGLVGNRGPGETQLEVDRRRIQTRITRLERDLDRLAKNRDTQRKGRRRSARSTVALVGYTNAGKSTLLNRLTDAHVVVEDRLFSTLDPTTRQLPASRRRDRARLRHRRLRAAPPAPAGGVVPVHARRGGRRRSPRPRRRCRLHRCRAADPRRAHRPARHRRRARSPSSSCSTRPTSRRPTR